MYTCGYTFRKTAPRCTLLGNTFRKTVTLGKVGWYHNGGAGKPTAIRVEESDRALAAQVSENKPLTAKVGGLTRKLKKGPKLTAKTGGGIVLRKPAASPAVAAPAASPAVAAAAKSGGVRRTKTCWLCCSYCC